MEAELIKNHIVSGSGIDWLFYPYHFVLEPSCVSQVKPRRKHPKKIVTIIIAKDAKFPLTRHFT